MSDPYPQDWTALSLAAPSAPPETAPSTPSPETLRVRDSQGNWVTVAVIHWSNAGRRNTANEHVYDGPCLFWGWLQAGAPANTQVISDGVETPNQDETIMVVNVTNVHAFVLPAPILMKRGLILYSPGTSLGASLTLLYTPLPRDFA